MSAVVIERWGYVTPSGARELVELERITGREPGDPQWRIAGSYCGMWMVDAAACVRDVARERGHDVEWVLSPAEGEGIVRVTLSLSRGSAHTWLKLLAQWSVIGTLGEPGEELRGELARALGEEGGA